MSIIKMTLNFANIGKNLGRYAALSSPLSPAIVGQQIANTVTSPKFVQGVKNFVGGVNDTMNYPAVAVGELGAFLSPRGSRAEYYFNDFANSARGTSDMGQDRGSVGYILGRAAPGLAVYGAMPAAGALPALGFAGVETAGLSTLGSFFDGDIARAYDWQQDGNGMYVTYGPGRANTGRTIVYRQATPYVQYAGY